MHYSRTLNTWTPESDFQSGLDQITPTTLCLSFPIWEREFNDSIYLIILLCRLSKLIFVKHLKQFLEHVRYCVNNV